MKCLDEMQGTILKNLISNKINNHPPKKTNLSQLVVTVSLKLNLINSIQHKTTVLFKFVSIFLS